MKRNISNNLLLICSIAIMAGCHAKKQVVARTAVDTPKASTVTTVDNLAAMARMKLAAIRARQVSFTTFSGKAKSKLNIDGNTNDVTLNIRILRGQKIWVSITAIIGIEVARAMITPDSIVVINKLQGIYFKKPFSYVYNYASRQVNYKTVESLLVGNAIPELLSDNATVTPLNGNVIISGNLQELLYKLMIGPDLKVSSTNLNNNAAQQSLQINYGNFIQASNRVIPSHIMFTSKVGSKNIQAELNYSRADFDQTLDFPFSIPNRYKQEN